jgi:hypothetical protein
MAGSAPLASVEGKPPSAEPGACKAAVNRRGHSGWSMQLMEASSL